MKCCTHLILCEALCIFTFFYFPDLGLSVSNGLHFNLWWHRENREFLGLPTMLHAIIKPTVIAFTTVWAKVGLLAMVGKEPI